MTNVPYFYINCATYRFVYPQQPRRDIKVECMWQPPSQRQHLLLTTLTWCHTWLLFYFSACPLSIRGTSAFYIVKGLFCPLCSSSLRALLRCCWVKTTSHNHTLSLPLTPSLTPSLTEKIQGSVFSPHYTCLTFPPFLTPFISLCLP